MIYLSGAPRASLEGLPNFGFMLQPAMGNRPNLTVTPWAADNGCFSTGDKFNLLGFYAFLSRHSASRPTCLFAVAPDVVADAAATYERSMPVLPVIRDMGYKAAYVAQDGLESLPVPWDEFDCLFVGGSTDWKLSEHAEALCHEAKARGKWVHVGRVNTLTRLWQSRRMGADSVDGTCLAFGYDANFPKLSRWVFIVNTQWPFARTTAP